MTVPTGTPSAQVRLRQPSHHATRELARPGGFPPNRLHGRCPDLTVCALGVWCSRWCWRLEQAEIRQEMRR